MRRQSVAEVQNVFFVRAVAVRCCKNSNCCFYSNSPSSRMKEELHRQYEIGEALQVRAV